MLKNWKIELMKLSLNLLVEAKAKYLEIVKDSLEYIYSKFKVR